MIAAGGTHADIWRRDFVALVEIGSQNEWQRSYIVNWVSFHGRTRVLTSRFPMPKKAIGFDTVRKIGLAMPGVEESTAYGAPALKVCKELLACVPTHRSAEPGSLLVRVDFDDRAALLAEAPDLYYVTDHCVGYSGVLVRLCRVTPDVLRDLLGMAHRFVTARTPSPSQKRSKRGPRKGS
jgi:hypothetical protein